MRVLDENPTQHDLFQGVLNKSIMNNLSVTVKILRKQYNLTQEELSLSRVSDYALCATLSKARRRCVSTK